MLIQSLHYHVQIQLRLGPGLKLRNGMGRVVELQLIIWTCKTQVSNGVHDLCAFAKCCYPNFTFEEVNIHLQEYLACDFIVYEKEYLIYICYTETKIALTNEYITYILVKSVGISGYHSLMWSYHVLIMWSLQNLFFIYCPLSCYSYLPWHCSTCLGQIDRLWALPN